MEKNPLYACVFGASGYIGTNLVPKLVAQGYSVRAVARNLKVLKAHNWEGVELRAADALKPATLAAALEGMDVAYYLVHSMAAGKDFGRLDLQAAENFAQAAGESRISRIVYLGGLVPRAAESQHLVSRQQTGDRLRQGPVPVTEIRAGIIVGPGSAAFEVMRDLVNYLPVMLTPRWVKSKSPPIALENLLQYLARIPEIAGTEGKVFEAAGPEHLSYEEMMKQYGEFVNKRPIIIPVPVLTPKLSSYWLRFVTAVPTNIARALIEGLKYDIGADGSALQELIPQQLVNFRESVRVALEAERRDTTASRWMEEVTMFRDDNPKYSYNAKKASGSAVTHASPEAVWHEVASIGGENRYYYLNMLWSLRETIDWMVGGPGLRRGRRHPNEVRLGDVIDSWRVVGVEPGRTLTLCFGMKAPGAGVLEFEITPESDGATRVTATAYWHPAGIWGLLYWYSLIPFHQIIFDGMTGAIAERAEAKQNT
ncbi:MAG: SDR family oxidoreductase [Thiogranum sp.]